jgi:hypothetical protein
MMTTDEILAKFKAECESAEAKFPKFHSLHEGYAVILEELYEVWDEIRADQTDLAIQEMIQVGAMALRFIENLQNFGKDV